MRLLLLFFLFSSTSLLAQNGKVLSADDQLFYRNLVRAFRENSIEKAKINWDDFERKVIEKAAAGRDSAIILALAMNGNPHTFYKSHGRYLFGASRTPRRDTSSALICKDVDNRMDIPGIGYLQIPAFTTDPADESGSKKRAQIYINSILDSIRANDERELQGWVIDLRNNTGGNMWPMLIALTPFYPNGTLGYFIDGEKNVSWSKSNGQIWNNNYSQTKRFLPEPVFYKLRNKNVKVAVLIGPRTSSSGEAVAISTKAIKKARLFGSRTSGFSTANKTIKIAEGEYLIVTTSVDADVDMKEYWDGVGPDYLYDCQQIENGLKQWFLE